MSKLPGVIAAAVVTAAVLAVPAAASTRPFAVVDNGGVLVTRAILARGEVIRCGGRAYTVTYARTSHGTTIFTVAPGLPASDSGKTLTFT